MDGVESTFEYAVIQVLNELGGKIAHLQQIDCFDINNMVELTIIETEYHALNYFIGGGMAQCEGIEVDVEVEVEFEVVGNDILLGYDNACLFYHRIVVIRFVIILFWLCLDCIGLIIKELRLEFA